MSKLTYPDNTAVYYTYDKMGNIKTVKDWNGKTTTYTYDKLNREKTITNPDGSKIEKTYDAIGNLSQMKEYDKSGSLVDHMVYNYDAANRLTDEIFKILNGKYHYTYDNLDRVVSRKQIDMSTNKVIEEQKFDYDKASNITSANELNASTSMKYNNKDNTLQNIEGLSFEYDKDGNCNLILIPGNTVKIAYDSQNHLISAGNDKYTYDAEDYRIKAVFKVETTTSSAKTKGKTGAQLFGFGNEEDITDEETTTEEATTEEATTEEVTTEETTTEETTTEEATTEEATTEEATTEEITTEEATTEEATTEETTVVETEAATEDNAEEATIDESFELIGEDKVNASTATTVTITSTYVYDRQRKNLLVKSDSDGTIEKYVYGNSLISSQVTKTSGTTTTKTHKVYHYDIRGSVIRVTNLSGTLTAQYMYTTYGTRLVVSGSSTEIMGYCGRDGVLTDPNMLLYMRARYCSKKISALNTLLFRA